MVTKMFTIMKHVIWILVVLISLSSHAQVEMKYDNGAVFQKVIEVDSTAPYLYKAVDRWVLRTFKNPDRVVKAKIENEEIRGDGFEPNGLVMLQATNTRDDFAYSFKIEVKQGRVRFTIFNMRGSMYDIEYYLYKKDGSPRTGGQAKSVKASATEVANELVTSLEESLKRPKKEDW